MRVDTITDTDKYTGHEILKRWGCGRPVRTKPHQTRHPPIYVDRVKSRSSKKLLSWSGIGLGGKCPIGPTHICGHDSDLSLSFRC